MDTTLKYQVSYVLSNNMDQQLPAWYIKKEQEVKDGKRHAWPCGGWLWTKRYSRRWAGEGDEEYELICMRCSEVLAES